MTNLKELPGPVPQSGIRRSVSISSALACATIVLVASLFVGSCRSAVVTSEDATLQERIADSLHQDHLDTIAVVVRDGRATLTGDVATSVEQEAAQRDAEQVEGVQAVVNHVRVKSP